MTLKRTLPSRTGPGAKSPGGEGAPSAQTQQPQAQQPQAPKPQTSAPQQPEAPTPTVEEKAAAPTAAPEEAQSSAPEPSSPAPKAPAPPATQATGLPPWAGGAAAKPAAAAAPSPTPETPTSEAPAAAETAPSAPAQNEEAGAEVGEEGDDAPVKGILRRRPPNVKTRLAGMGSHISSALNELQRAPADFGQTSADTPSPAASATEGTGASASGGAPVSGGASAVGEEPFSAGPGGIPESWDVPAAAPAPASTPAVPSPAPQTPPAPPPAVPSPAPQTPPAPPPAAPPAPASPPPPSPKGDAPSFAPSAPAKSGFDGPTLPWEAEVASRPAPGQTEQEESLAPITGGGDFYAAEDDVFTEAPAAPAPAAPSASAASPAPAGETKEAAKAKASASSAAGLPPWARQSHTVAEGEAPATAETARATGDIGAASAVHQAKEDVPAFMAEASGNTGRNLMIVGVMALVGLGVWQFVSHRDRAVEILARWTGALNDISQELPADGDVAVVLPNGASGGGSVGRGTPASGGEGRGQVASGRGGLASPSTDANVNIAFLDDTAPAGRPAAPTPNPRQDANEAESAEDMPEDISAFAAISRAITEKKKERRIEGSAKLYEEEEELDPIALSEEEKVRRSAQLLSQAEAELDAYRDALVGVDNPALKPKPGRFFSGYRKEQEGLETMGLTPEPDSPTLDDVTETAQSTQAAQAAAEAALASGAVATGQGGTGGNGQMLAPPQMSANLPVLSEPATPEAPTVRQLSDFEVAFSAPNEPRVRIPRHLTPQLGVERFPPMELLSLLPQQGIIALTPQTEGALMIGEMYKGWELIRVTQGYAEFQKNGQSHTLPLQ